MSISNGPLPPVKVNGTPPSYVENQQVQFSMDPSDAGVRVHITNGGGGGSGGAVTVADGADVTQGAIADVAVALDANGTVNAHIRGLVKILASVWSAGNSWLQVSIQNATLAVTSSGVGAAGAAVAGNPVRSGGLGRTTLPAAVSSAQLVDLLLDRYGRTFVLSPVLTLASSAGTPITTNTNTAIVAAPAAGNHLRIHRVWAQNSSATATWCYWGNGSGVKTIPFYLGQAQPFSMDLKGAWELSTATGLFLNTATTGANIEWFTEYETLAD